MEQFAQIEISRLHPHPDNPRKNLGDITELTESVRKNGIMQNLTVVPNGENEFTVIIGHRRLAAAKAAGLETLPCRIADLTDAEQVLMMLEENMQRSDLTPLEQAYGFQMISRKRQASTVQLYITVSTWPNWTEKLWKSCSRMKNFS